MMMKRTIQVLLLKGFVKISTEYEDVCLLTKNCVKSDEKGKAKSTTFVRASVKIKEQMERSLTIPLHSPDSNLAPHLPSLG